MKDAMKKYRLEIDKCDKKICKYLIKRFNIVKLIGKYKKENNIPILNSNREEEVKKKLRNIVGNNLPESSIENIYSAIMDEAKKLQK